MCIDDWGSGWILCVVIYILLALNGVCGCLLSEHMFNMMIRVSPELNDFGVRVYNNVCVLICLDGSMFLSVVVVYDVDVYLARVE